MIPREITITELGKNIYIYLLIIKTLSVNHLCGNDLNKSCTLTVLGKHPENNYHGQNYDKIMRILAGIRLNLGAKKGDNLLHD